MFNSLLSYLFIIILPIKSTLLFTLVTQERGAILFHRIGTPLTFGADEGGQNVTMFTRRGFPKYFDIAFTFLADWGSSTFPAIQNSIYSYFFSKLRF